MIKIDKYKPEFEQEYLKFIKKRFKLSHTNGLEAESIRNKVKNKKYQQLYIDYFDSVSTNLDFILIGSLEELIKINDVIWNENYKLKQIIDSNKAEYDNYINICKTIFNYDDKLSKHKNFAYKLSRECGINVCPYCNINYTYTISDKYNDYIRPDFDHFLPKSKYPILTLSLYNLIPCCHTCNHQKSDNEFSLIDNLYPYNEGLQHEKVFSHKIISININQYEVMITNDNSKFKNNRIIFHLDEIYKASFNNIIHKKHEIAEMYCNNYLKSLENIDKSLRIQQLEEILGYTNDVQNTSLGKMTNDIIQEIVSDMNEL